MIVLDASVVIDLLLNIQPQATAISSRIATSRQLYAPHLIDAEVGQVLRRYALRGEISSTQAATALRELQAFPLQRYAHTPLLERAFELRDNVTVYDALYIVLAEGLGATLLTRDAALAVIPGHSAAVELVPS